MDPKLSQKIITANLELHHKEAQYYDLIHREIFNPEEQSLISHVLADAIEIINMPSISALDIGAGTGNITLKLLDNKNIGSIVVVDLSKEMLEQLQFKLESNPKVKIVNADIDSFLEAQTKGFDLITISSVLHHLPDYFETTEKILKKLNAGGALLIFHEPTGQKSKLLEIITWLDSRLFVNLLLPPLVKEVITTLDHSYSDYHVYHDFDLEGLKKHFENKGLEIFYFNQHNVFSLGIFRWLARLIPQKNNFILGIKKLK
ncbi:MAG: class I SAM-dependent methyltransferase [Candidatus Parcubacteria bacterium]|nr:class I SAM-dependent methyltransferase [Candidatus Parcubacteria bacterium]